MKYDYSSRILDEKTAQLLAASERAGQAVIETVTVGRSLADGCLHRAGERVPGDNGRSLDFQEGSLLPLSYLKFANLAELGLPHAVSTRVGGVSRGAYQGLNIGQTTVDNTRHVHENRERLSAAVGFPLVTVLNMEHGINVVKLASIPRSLRVGDACITNVPGVPMMITTADCVPLILYDPCRHALGLAHAGWRGTVAGVGAATVRAMQEAYGCCPQDLQVGIGPSIGPCCFEVGEDTAEMFQRAYAYMSREDSLAASYERGNVADGDIKAATKQELPIFTRRGNDNKPRVDLWLANLVNLCTAGVLPEHVCISRLCSACHPELFFSYRRDKGVTGRMATMAELP